MGKVEVKTEVNAPDEIKIYLIREDHLQTSNIFRIFFEIFLTITGTLLGTILSTTKADVPTPIITYIAFGASIVFCFAFLLLSTSKYKEAKSSKKE